MLIGLDPPADAQRCWYREETSELCSQPSESIATVVDEPSRRLVAYDHTHLPSHNSFDRSVDLDTDRDCTHKTERLYDRG